MKAFKQHRGLVLTLDNANIDTDQIIPKQFLKSISRTGFGPALFYDWRYLPDGKPNPEFRLNFPQFKNASILVVRNNFGCGSSREHAVWAIQQYGFQVVIAPFIQRNGSRLAAFADIFRNNSFKNALLTIELSENEVQEIFDQVGKNPGLEATIDLEKQDISLHGPNQNHYFFKIDDSNRKKLLNGLDDIGSTLLHQNEIDAFEKRHLTYL